MAFGDLDDCRVFFFRLFPFFKCAIRCVASLALYLIYFDTFALSATLNSTLPTVPIMTGSYSFDDPTSGAPGAVTREILEEENVLLVDSDSAEHYGSTKNHIEPTISNLVPEISPTQFLVISISIYLGIFLAAVDTTVVTTILTLVASDLDALPNISWIATAYLLSSSVFQPLWGKLSDIFGRKPPLVLCCIFFAVGCAICNTSSLAVLVLGRFITGLGGSGLTSLGSITFTDIVPLRDRGIYQGIGNIAFGLGAASGGAVGGLIADKLGWRYVFLTQVPLALFVGLCIAFCLNLPPGSPGLGASDHEFVSKLKRVDFVGSLLLVLALMGILTAASFGGREISYTSPTFVVLLVGAVILLVAFAKWENEYAAEPTLPVKLLSTRAVLCTCMTTWFYTMSVFSYLFYIPVYYTSVMGFSATENGSRLVPNFFAVALGSLGAGFHMKKTGKYYKMMLVMDIVSLLGVIRMIGITPQISKFTQFTLFLPSGFAYAWCLTVTLLSLIAAVPSKYQAATTSIQYTFRATGSTLGVAVASAIFQNVLRANLTSTIYGLLPHDKILAREIIAKALDSTKNVEGFPEVVKEAVRDSYANGCKGSLYFAVASMAVGCFFSIFIEEHVLHSTLERK